MHDSLSYRFGQSVRHKRLGVGQFIRSTPTHATVQFPRSWRASVVPIGSIEPVEQTSQRKGLSLDTKCEHDPDHPDPICEPCRTCDNCGDTVPIGWTLDDHFNCNWPEDFEGWPMSPAVSRAINTLGHKGGAG